MKTQIAAIEFGTSKIVTVIARSGNNDRMDIIGAGTVPYDGYSRGDWNTPGRLAQCVGDSLAAAELEANTKIKEIYVGVPGEYTHMLPIEVDYELPDGMVTDDAINTIYDIAADQLNLIDPDRTVLHRSPAWYILDEGKKTMSPGGDGKHLHAMISFITVENFFIEDVAELLATLDVTILGFLSTTLGQSLLTLTPDDRDRTAILIDSGYLNTELSVVEGDAIVYHSVIPTGGGHFTADLADALRLPMRSAEKLKREYVFNPDQFDKNSPCEVLDENGRRRAFKRDRVSSVIEPAFDDLANNIKMTVENDMRDYLGKRVQVFLTGGGIAMMRGARKALEGVLNMPVKMAATKSSKLNSPVYTAALGLADLVFDSIEVDDEPEPEAKFELKNLFKKR